MKKEYIIVDSNNNWLLTETSKREALATFKEIVKCGKDGEEFAGVEIGDEVWLYQAVEIKSDKTY